MTEVVSSEAIVTRVAKALYAHWVNEQVEECAPWEKLGDKETWRDRARAAIVAIRQEEY